jgi:hypothetical protein
MRAQQTFARRTMPRCTDTARVAAARAVAAHARVLVATPCRCARRRQLACEPAHAARRRRVAPLCAAAAASTALTAPEPPSRPLLAFTVCGATRAARSSAQHCGVALTCLSDVDLRGARQGGGIFFFWQVGAVVALQERVALRDCDMARAPRCAASAFTLAERGVYPCVTQRRAPLWRADRRQRGRADRDAGGVRRGLEGAHTHWRVRPLLLSKCTLVSHHPPPRAAGVCRPSVRADAGGGPVQPSRRPRRRAPHVQAAHLRRCS